jgi:hypothetical protein
MVIYMMFTLVKIAPNGVRSNITTDFDEGILITTAHMLKQKNQDDQYGVVNDHGFFIWPDKLTQAHIEPAQYDPIIPDRYGSPEQ